jgi:hypothetical protein
MAKAATNSEWGGRAARADPLETDPEQAGRADSLVHRMHRAVGESLETQVARCRAAHTKQQCGQCLCREERGYVTLTSILSPQR